jgi:putative sigma-54 modulation protein
MQINLTGKNIQITDPLRTYVNSKFKRINRHFDELIDIHVVLDVEKHEQRAEATIKARGKAIFADAKKPDMYAAIDVLIDKLDRQIIKHKEKIRDHHAIPSKAIPIE